MKSSTFDERVLIFPKDLCPIVKVCESQVLSWFSLQCRVINLIICEHFVVCML